MLLYLFSLLYERRVKLKNLGHSVTIIDSLSVNNLLTFNVICNQSKNRIVIVSSHNNIFQNNAVEIIDFDQEKK